MDCDDNKQGEVGTLVFEHETQSTNVGRNGIIVTRCNTALAALCFLYLNLSFSYVE